MKKRKRILLGSTAVLAVALMVLTIISYIRYDSSIPIVTVVSPVPDLENATYADYENVILPISCIEYGSVFVVKQRKGLFSDELYVEVPSNLKISRQDEDHIYIPVGIILPTDQVVLTANRDFTNGSVVKILKEDQN